VLPEIASFRHLLLLHLSASLRYPLLTVLRLKAVPVDRSSFTNTDRLELTTVNSSQLITVNGPSFNNRSSSIVQNPSSFFSLFYLLMLVQRVNYGEISVIPFIFPLYSHYYLLLLRANYETIILYNHMANVIKLRKGLDINLKGKAAEELSTVKEPGFYALVPDDFPGVTPKVVVKEQEYVMAGGPLFIDKNHPEVKFVSPVSGVVTSVERGARRKVLNIVVEAAAEQDYEEFGKKDVSKLDGEAVKAALLEAGMFAFMKQRPYDVIADPTVAPRAIFISAFDSNPLAPDFEYVLKGEEANFQTGLDALAKIAKTYLGISIKQKSTALTQAKNVTVTVFDGPNPAGNVGVQINHVAPVVKGETVWTIGAEAVIFIGRLFNTGRVDLTRTVAVTGSEVVKPAYCKLKVGALLTHVFAGNVTKDKELRYISGNVLTGKQVKPNGFLGAFDSQLTVIPEGDDIHEMLGWIMPRFNQFSVNRSYFSWLMGNKKEYVLDARIKGGERHMIMSGEYDKVFPMDILPEFLIKAIIAGDIDRMEALGIYEVAPEDFALCEFVDSSKLELQRIVRAGLDMLRAEMM
jgi:NADH:ubiquinone oxidoreductase, Na(+)-translocating, A subunit